MNLKGQTYFLALILTCWVHFKAQSQNIVLDVQALPLKQVLEQLRDKHGIQFSLNHQLLTDCKISLSASFENAEKALDKVLLPCGLTYQKVNGVFVIERKAIEQDLIPVPKPKIYYYSGQILDAQSLEPLAFASLQLNNSQLSSDGNGYFSYRSTDSILQMKVAHIGYFRLDSLLLPAKGQQIKLQASLNELQEVLILADQNAEFSLQGKHPGLIQLNTQSARLLPGYSNNALHNLLRLQAGVLAAGEQSKDYMIWGSYKGQSQVVYDGMTIFNTGSFNDHISTINPLIINDIELYKGGYNVHIGDRVGAFVNINSKSGDKEEQNFVLSFDNQLLNAYYNIPIAQKASLQFALRKSYPNLFSAKTYQKTNPESFNFGDLNVKYSHSINSKEHFSISLLGNIDNNSSYYSKTIDAQKYTKWEDRNQQQLGAAFLYSKAWNRIGRTQFQMAFSQSAADYSNKLEILTLSSPRSEWTQDNFTQNHVREFIAKLEHALPSTKYHNLSFGLAAIYNQTAFSQDSSDLNLKTAAEDLVRLSGYFKDKISMGKHWTIQPGLRLDLPLQSLKPMLQPRIDAAFSPNEHWRFYLAYGLYRQFIVENTIVDNYNNYLYQWSLATEKQMAVPKSLHRILGFSYGTNWLHITVEGYHKNTQNLLQYYHHLQDSSINLMQGLSRSYGVDFQLKTQLKKHQFWLTYSLGKTEERFDKTLNYVRAPQDQRHELKAVAILDFHPFYLSTNYVWGSGFPNGNSLFPSDNIRHYSRLDLAFQYRFNYKKLHFELGASVLNILNTPNIRYNNFYNFPDSEKALLPATPISPVFLARIWF